MTEIEILKKEIEFLKKLQFVESVNARNAVWREYGQKIKALKLKIWAIEDKQYANVRFSDMNRQTYYKLKSRIRRQKDKNKGVSL